MKYILFLLALTSCAGIRTAQDVRRVYGDPEIVRKNSVQGWQIWHYREADATQSSFLIWSDSTIHAHARF